MQGHIHQESRRKKYWIVAGLFYHIHHIQQTLHQVISIFIHSLQDSLNDEKCSQVD